MSPVVLRTRIVLVLLLAGCSSSLLEPKRIDYKTASASNVPTLEIPPDLTSPARDDRYAVPDTAGKGTATYSAYTAERSPQARAQQKNEVLPEVDKAHIERAGNQRWLVVAGSPGKLWDPVKEFWQETGFVIKLDLPDAGVMETDWAENRAKIEQDFIRNLLGKLMDSVYSTAERDKFRTRLEPGSTPGTTDIFISHRGMYEDGVTVIKFWFSISQEEQLRRFESRRRNPLKQWKLSPVDERAQDLWDTYTWYKEQMFSRTHTSFAPWIIVRADNKRVARLESMRYVLSLIDYAGKEKSRVSLFPDPNIITRFHRGAVKID